MKLPQISHDIWFVQAQTCTFYHTDTHTHTGRDGNHDNSATCASSSPTLFPSIAFSLSHSAFVLFFTQGSGSFPKPTIEEKLPETLFIFLLSFAFPPLIHIKLYSHLSSSQWGWHPVHVLFAFGALPCSPLCLHLLTLLIFSPKEK